MVRNKSQYLIKSLFLKGLQMPNRVNSTDLKICHINYRQYFIQYPSHYRQGTVVVRCSYSAQHSGSGLQPHLLNIFPLQIYRNFHNVHIYLVKKIFYQHVLVSFTVFRWLSKGMLWHFFGSKKLVTQQSNTFCTLLLNSASPCMIFQSTTCLNTPSITLFFKKIEQQKILFRNCGYIYKHIYTSSQSCNFCMYL